MPPAKRVVMTVKKLSKAFKSQKDRMTKVSQM